MALQRLEGDAENRNLRDGCAMLPWRITRTGRGRRRTTLGKSGFSAASSGRWSNHQKLHADSLPGQHRWPEHSLRYLAAQCDLETSAVWNR